MKKFNSKAEENIQSKKTLKGGMGMKKGQRVQATSSSGLMNRKQGRSSGFNQMKTGKAVAEKKPTKPKGGRVKAVDRISENLLDEMNNNDKGNRVAIGLKCGKKIETRAKLRSLSRTAGSYHRSMVSGSGVSKRRPGVGRNSGQNVLVGADERRDASMMKNKQKELKRKVGLKEKQERLQVEKKIVKKVDTSASMVAENPKFRSARKTVKKLSIGNPRGQSRSVSRYYRSLTDSRPSQRRPRTREPISVKIQLKEKLQIRSEMKSFGGKDKSAKTAPSKGLIGGEKQLNFVEGKPFVCKEKDCGKAFRYKCNLKRHNLLVHVHAKERNFSCPAPGCGKDFGTRASLERHMTIHGEQVSKIATELETPVDRMTVKWQEENQAVPQSGSSGNEEMKKFAPQNIQISNKEEENKERWKEIVPENWEDTFYPFLDVFYECALPDCPDCEKLGML